MTKYTRVTEQEHNEGRGYIPYSTLNSANEADVNLWCPVALYGRDFQDAAEACDYGCTILDDENDKLAAEAAGPEIYAVTGPML